MRPLAPPVLLAMKSVPWIESNPSNGNGHHTNGAHTVYAWHYARSPVTLYILIRGVFHVCRSHLLMVKREALMASYQSWAAIIRSCWQEALGTKCSSITARKLITLWVRRVQVNIKLKSGADPGFCVPTYNFAKMSGKMHEVGKSVSGLGLHCKLLVLKFNVLSSFQWKLSVPVADPTVGSGGGVDKKREIYTTTFWYIFMTYSKDGEGDIIPLATLDSLLYPYEWFCSLKRFRFFVNTHRITSLLKVK